MASLPRLTKAHLAAALAVAALLWMAHPGGAVAAPDTRVAHVFGVHKNGPPPWAPAHGYRAKHQSGVDLFYDRYLGVYTVGGHPGCYFGTGRFFCRRDGGWHSSELFGGPWRVITADRLPPGLAREYWHKHPKKAKHRRKHMRKHGLKHR